MPTDMQDRLEAIRERIRGAAARAGRPADRVGLVAVAKTATPESLAAAWEAGQRDFGHNRVQALEEHADCLPAAARWHLIGPLQRNKARRAAQRATLIHTVGDTAIAHTLARVAGEIGRPRLRVLVQVNLTPEDGRYGCREAELAALLAELAGLGELEVAGLMTLGPHGASEPVLHRHFARLRELAHAHAGTGGLPADPELSMGMTEDYEIAVEEGATLVRIGRAVFSPPGSS